MVGRNIKRLDNYILCKEKIRFQCLIKGCNYIWLSKPDNILTRGRGCPKCSNKIRLTNENVDDRLQNRSIIRLDIIINNKTRIRWQCSKCNHIWKTTPMMILNENTGCPDCKSRLLSNDDIDNRLKDRLIKRIDNYITGRIKITFQCLTCLKFWQARPGHVLFGSGCPHCPLKNETIVYDTLLSNNISVERHKHIKKIICSESGNLMVDFYLPNKNIIIEYNGAQHYQPTCFSNYSVIKAQENFEKQINRDLYLRQFCIKNNIKLICIDGRKYSNSKLENYVNESIIPIIRGDI